MGNTSLDDFLGSEASDPADGEAAESADAPESPESAEPTEPDQTPDADDGPDAADEAGDASDAAGDADPEPAVSTCDFAPDGAPCAACGETVERRWRDDRGLVCPDCKAW